MTGGPWPQKYPQKSLKVGFLNGGLVATYRAQPDVARCVQACMATLRQVVVDTFGSDNVVDLPVPGLPVFGSEWTTAVGAFRYVCVLCVCVCMCVCVCVCVCVLCVVCQTSIGPQCIYITAHMHALDFYFFLCVCVCVHSLARFRREGLTSPSMAAQIDHSITRDWPVIDTQFTVDAMGEVFAKIAETNQQLAALFAHCHVVVAPALGLEAYKARGPAAYIAMGETTFNPAHNPFEGMMPLNYSGHPSAVVRAGMTDSGLPCGVQLIAERGHDMDALLLASMYEDVSHCFDSDSWPSWPFVAEAPMATPPSKL